MALISPARRFAQVVEMFCFIGSRIGTQDGVRIDGARS